jgi:hypothetical protein
MEMEGMVADSPSDIAFFVVRGGLKIRIIP